MYLVAVIDWHSRFILSWKLSNFCIEALSRVLEKARPEIFNTDQGCHFTSKAFLALLKERNIRISMDGRGRALDNIFVERFWHLIKYESFPASSNLALVKAFAQSYLSRIKSDSQEAFLIVRYFLELFWDEASRSWKPKDPSVTELHSLFDGNCRLGLPEQTLEIRSTKRSWLSSG